ncbi:hypothetical protein ACFQV2_27890 [Actinokineospora soli]|uniref:Polyketide cyclase / dehydrase and lipid transport n=1 Tax=Actinokineospora soli TaxID=1048753 RepID=A0ABW2TSB6_9PSEU
MTNALGRVLRGVRGEWTFTADGPGAVVRWTYEFLPARRALVAGVVVPVWRRYQARCLAAVVRVIGG